jgi:hypothetical protein
MIIAIIIVSAIAVIPVALLCYVLYLLSHLMDGW